MEKTRRLKAFSIVALIVAVLGLTIAFAALSKTLTINGTGTVDAANWDIHFKNISEASLTGKATTTGTPKLADNGATINDMKVSLKEPGDKVVYTVDIENSGDINAEIDSITLPTFTTAQSNILDFKAVYTSNNKEISEGDILTAKEVKNVTITIMYKDITDESLLPSEGISINLNYALHFVQTDKASGSSSQGGNNPSSSYGVAIVSKQLTDTITATYYGGEEQQDGTYQGGTLVISGTGELSDYDDENFDLLLLLANVETVDELSSKFNESTKTIDFKYNPTDLIIENGITKIGSNSFRDFFVSIKNVTISNSVSKIGEAAFSYMPITSVIIPDGVTIIESETFSNTKLTSITIPNSVTSIGYNAFSDTQISTVTIPSSVTRIDPAAFSTPNFVEMLIESDAIDFSNGGSSGASIPKNAILYCKTQACYDNLQAQQPLNNVNGNVNISLDPTKFN